MRKMLAQSKTTTVDIVYGDEDGEHKFVLLEFPHLGLTQSVGFHLYEASVLLSKFLVNELSGGTIKAKRILELGSGSCGLAGLSLTRLGHQVTFSDLGVILPSLKANVERNAKDVEKHAVIELAWGDIDACTKLGMFDLVIGADVVYQQEFVIPLLKTMRMCVKREAWICAEVRDQSLVDGYFIEQAKAHGFSIKRIKQKQLPEPFCSSSSDHMRLFKLQKNSSSTSKLLAPDT